MLIYVRAFSNLWKLWVTTEKSDLAVFTAVGNPAAVPGDTIALAVDRPIHSRGSAGAGGVRPVKAVEPAGQLGGIRPRAGVGDREIYIPSPLAQGETDRSPWITVFDRVVQQNGKQTKHIFLHPTELDSGWDVGLQAFALRLCQRLKAFCAGLSHLAEEKRR